MRKILLSLLILLSFSVIVILPNSLNICVPGGCTFNSGACNDNACVNETMMQHLGERTQLLNVAIKFQSFIILAIVLLFSIVVQKFLEDGKFIAIKSYVKQKLLNSSGVEASNYLIEAFSNGILHPKIY